MGDAVALFPRGEQPAHVPDGLVVEFDVYSPPKLQEGFHEAWKTLQDSDLGNIVWTPCNGGHWIATSAALMPEVLSDYETFSSRSVIVPKEVGESYHILPTHLSPPEHRPFRKLLNAGLSPKKIISLQPQIAKAIADLVEGVREKGECCFTTEIAELFPTSIIMIILGLPVEDGPYLKIWADHIMRPDGTVTISEAEAKLIEYLRPIIADRQANPQDDMISGLVNGTVDDRELTEDEYFQLVLEVVIAGLDTVVNFMNFVWFYLGSNPKARQELVDDPTLIMSAADEFIRRYGLVMVGRVIEKDITFHGVDMKEGEMIIAPTFLSALDEEMNSNPMEVDFHRNRVSHTTFGSGPHRCAGASLARVEIIAALQEWLARIPEFSVKESEKPVYSSGTVGSMGNVHLLWDPATTRKV